MISPGQIEQNILSLYHPNVKGRLEFQIFIFLQDGYERTANTDTLVQSRGGKTNIQVNFTVFKFEQRFKQHINKLRSFIREEFLFKRQSLVSV